MYSIGSVVGAPELEVYVYDTSTGALADATSVAVAIILPDGTTATPPSVTHVSTGRYAASYTTVQAGRHKVAWTGTGTNAFVIETTFEVRSATGWIVGLADAKDFLNITSSDTGYDDELGWFLDVVSQMAEDHCGQLFRRQSVVEKHSGDGPAVILHRSPVLSVTTVTENGTMLAATGYDFDPEAGILWRLGGSYSATDWASGLRNVTVTYVAGWSDPPEPVRHGALVLLKHLWETQRGTFGLARAGASTEDGFVPGSTFSLPNRVIELWRPYVLPGVA